MSDARHVFRCSNAGCACMVQSWQPGAPDCPDCGADMEEVPAATPATAPTAPAQPEADEVEALARVMDDADAACVRSWSTDDTVYVTVPWEEKVERIRDRRRAMARASIAWAARRYGGEAAALRAAAERLQRKFGRGPDGRPLGEFMACKPCPKCGTYTNAAHDQCAWCDADAVLAALALTPSAAAEAVERLVEAARAFVAVETEPGTGKCRRCGCYAGGDTCATCRVRDALKPFLPARGGEAGA